MTREKAISRIQQALNVPNRLQGLVLIDEESANMAIEALSREQKKYDVICAELVELKSDLNLPIEVAMAYEKSIRVVRKYAKMGDTK